MTKYIPLILFTVLTNAASQLMLKKGMLVTGQFAFSADGLLGVIPRLVTNPFLIGGLLILVISMCSHLLVLSRVELSFAYPFLSLAYVVVALQSYLIFGEQVNSIRVAGIACIVLGTVLVSRS